MHSKNTSVFLFGLILSFIPASAQQSATKAVPEIPGLPAAARAAAASIDAERIRAHVRFLSLDLLEGRADPVAPNRMGVAGGTHSGASSRENFPY